MLFVTHEINPILPYVDRVLYLVDGRFRIGTVDEVMTSEKLSELYQTEVEVVQVRGRLRRGAATSDGYCHEWTHRLEPACWHNMFAFDITATCCAAISCSRRCSPAALLALIAGIDRPVHRDAANVVRSARVQRIILDRSGFRAARRAQRRRRRVGGQPDRSGAVRHARASVPANGIR